MRIDLRNKLIDTGHGKELMSKIVEEDEKYLKMIIYHFNGNGLRNFY